MEPNEDQARRVRAESIAEYAIGLSLLAKGWDEAAHFAEFPFRVIFIFFAGLFIIAGTKLRHRIERKIPNFHGVFEILEGLVEIAAATIMLEKGKQFIPAFLALIGLIYVSRGIVDLATRPENRAATLRTYRMILGLVLIAFAVPMGVINALTRRDAMVYFAIAVLIASAVFTLIRRNSPMSKRLNIVEKAAKLLKK